MRSISQLEQAEALDRVVVPGQRVARWLRPGPVRDALNGVWLGHPLHPVLAQAPVGAWLSAAVLDAWPRGRENRAGKHGGRESGGEGGQRRLVAFGLAAAGAAALAGAADWSEQHEQQMRVGVVHAAANVTAAGFYGASLLTRRPAAAGPCAWPGWPRYRRADCSAATSRSGSRAGPIRRSPFPIWSSRAGTT